MKRIFIPILTFFSIYPIFLILPTKAFGQNDIYWNAGTTAPTSTPPAANYTVGSFTQNNNNGTTTFITTASASGSAGNGGYSFSLNGSLNVQSGSENFGLAARVGSLNVNAGGSAYIEVIITPFGGYKLSISNINFGSRSTSTGPQNYSIQTVINNVQTEVINGALSNNSTWAYVTNSVLITESSSQPITIRIYGYGGTGSPGANTANWRLDDIVITTSAISLPVTFGKVQAIQSNDQLKIQWSTLAETNNDHFDIEVSGDGSSFKKIATVTSKPKSGLATQKFDYEYQLNINELAGFLGMLFLFGLFSFGFSKRQNIIVGVIVVFIFGFAISCNKNDISTISKTKSIYVRIGQVDVDGKKAYSKIVKAENLTE